MDLNVFKINFENALLGYETKKVYDLFELYKREFEEIDFIDEIILDVLQSIGDKWENGEVALSQVYMGSKLCEELSDNILSRLPQCKRTSLRLAIVTLEDHHVLGKKIVSTVIKSAGYELMDYGVGLKAETVIDLALSDKLDVLLISVLMYNSALKVKKITDELKRANSNTRVLVGGAPFLIDPCLWEDVGADALGKNAAAALELIKQLMNEADAS